MQLTNSEENDLKRASHNIMRFGRTAGHNIMRFGRAGHNIMHFGKRDSAMGGAGMPLSQETVAMPVAAYAAGAGFGPQAQDFPDSEGIADEQLYVKRQSTSYGPRLLIPHLFLSSLYTPYRRLNYNYNKKADKDNVFMHFG